MKFQDWADEIERELKIRYERDKAVYFNKKDPNWTQNNIQLFTNYKIYKTNQRLVITTAILVGITFFLGILTLVGG